MKCQSAIVNFFILVAVSAAAVKLPSYIKKCSYTDPKLNECVTATAIDIWATFLKGDKNIHFHKADPLHVPSMHLNVNGNLLINMTDCDIYGLEEAKDQKITLDFENKKFVIQGYMEKCSLIGDYDINGRILVLPITGTGPSNITFVGGTFKFESNIDVVAEKGKHYLKYLDNHLTYTVKRAYFKLENLFNGNKALAEQMNQVLDENWKDVNDEIGAQIEKALGDVFQTLFGQLFDRLPLEECFLDFPPV